MNNSRKYRYDAYGADTRSVIPPLRLKFFVLLDSFRASQTRAKHRFVVWFGENGALAEVFLECSVSGVSLNGVRRPNNHYDPKRVIDLGLKKASSFLILAEWKSNRQLFVSCLCPSTGKLLADVYCEKELNLLDVSYGSEVVYEHELSPEEFPLFKFTLVEQLPNLRWHKMEKLHLCKTGGTNCTTGPTSSTENLLQAETEADELSKKEPLSSGSPPITSGRGDKYCVIIKVFSLLCLFLLICLICFVRYL
ncbi:ORF2 [Cnidium closterovirus 1]|nr:ORF2 [Cnidium closterovirus 1]